MCGIFKKFIETSRVVVARDGLGWRKPDDVGQRIHIFIYTISSGDLIYSIIATVTIVS